MDGVVERLAMRDLKRILKRVKDGDSRGLGYTVFCPHKGQKREEMLLDALVEDGRIMLQESREAQKGNVKGTWRFYVVAPFNRWEIHDIIGYDS
jgi:hypothetical protein